MRVLPALLVALLSPVSALACSCACGVFDVGAGQRMPARPGGFVGVEYGSIDQSRNWSGASRASGDANPDKRIHTDFITGRVANMVDRSWGWMLDVPVVKRRFTTTDSNGRVGVLENSALGDIRVRGVYAGLSADMSTGLTFGLKLPTGPFKTPDFDRDAQIGTGSTDLLLGAYHMGRLPRFEDWGWFADGQWDEPALSAGGYRPGAEVDAAVGAYFEGIRAGDFKLAPLAQALGTWRWRDQGTSAMPSDTGYRRLMLSPGFEASYGRARLYADAEFPVYQFVNGGQLVAAELYKLGLGWTF